MAEGKKQPRLVFADYIVPDARAGAAGVLRQSGLCIEADKIVAVDTQDSLQAAYPDAQIIGGEGRVALPGLVNAHSHGRGLSTPLQGVPDDILELWLVTLPLMKRLSPYWNTLHSAAQLLLAGVTTVIHSHVGGGELPAYRQGVELAVQAYEDAQMRVAFAMGFKEQHQLVFGDEAAFLASVAPSLRSRIKSQLLARPNISIQEYFDLLSELFERYEAADHPRTTLFLSPVGPQWCTDTFMSQVARCSQERGAGVHIHVSESIYEKLYGFREWGTSTVEHLDHLGLLSPRLSLVHAVWLSEREIELCAQAGAVVVHNASSNLRLYNGIAPINAMLAAGVPVALGIDSTAIDDDEDMLREMRLAFYLHRTPGIRAAAPDAYKILELATIGGARAALLQDRIGTLEVGKQADIVLLNLERISSPFLDPVFDVVEAILVRGRAEDVETVLVDGKIVVENGRLKHLDMAQILEMQREAATQTATADGALHDLLNELKPKLIRYYEGWTWDDGAQPFYARNSRR